MTIHLQLLTVALQGAWVRAITEAPPPPAAGPTEGVVDGDGGPPLRLLVVGDSTAAGCGVDTHADAFTGNFADALTVRTRRPVHWRVVGQYGATARRIRHRLVPSAGTGYDLAVLLCGGNDVMSRRGAAQWRDDLTAIVSELEDRADRVTIVGIPPFVTFPALPASLGRYLSGRADALDDVSRQICATSSRTTWVTATGVPTRNFFASDGLHLSATGYRYWARSIASQLDLG
ncbi:SGNH/GDSL hydrolase family protein [Cryptosporangium japonicum]|uniref:SGNH/GDSL hydrolase family protein n=1 Tax=Cryptosporangium japonicum TaxID=80872 RepID=A0ABN0TR92_9ACTN